MYQYIFCKGIIVKYKHSDNSGQGLSRNEIKKIYSENSNYLRNKFPIPPFSHFVRRDNIKKTLNVTCFMSCLLKRLNTTIRTRSTSLESISEMNIIGSRQNKGQREMEESSSGKLSFLREAEVWAGTQHRWFKYSVSPVLNVLTLSWSLSIFIMVSPSP